MADEATRVTGPTRTVSRRSWRISAHPVSWLLLACTTLAILMTSIDATILASVLPFVKTHFGLDDTGAGLINSLFFIGTVAGAFFFGWLSDVVGNGYRRSWVWIIAMGLSVVGGVGTFAFASSWVAFQVMRVVMGVSRGGSEPTNVAIVGEWWQKENRGFAVGTHHIGFPLGQFVGPAIIAFFATQEDWSKAFLVIPLIGLPIMIAQAVLGTRRNQVRVNDWILAHGMTPPLDVDDDGRMHRNAVAILRDAVAVPNIVRAIFVNFGFLWCELGLTTFLVVLLAQRTDMSSAQAIVASGASGLTGWFGQMLWGTVSDHLGRRRVLLILGLGWILCVIPLLFVTTGWQAWLALLVWGLFRNAPFPVLYSVVLDSAPRQAGSAMGLIIGLTTGLGGAITSAVTGIVLQHFGWGWTFASLIAGVVMAVIAILTLEETVVRAEDAAVAA
ncbi:MFS transporter [Propionibacterium acidifaciens]